MIFKYFKRIKQEKEIDLKNRIAQAELKTKLKHEKATNEILNKRCPFMNGNNCNKKCVHFDDGYHGALYFDLTDVVYEDYKAPRCKLWRD